MPKRKNFSGGGIVHFHTIDKGVVFNGRKKMIPPENFTHDIGVGFDAANSNPRWLFSGN